MDRVLFSKILEKIKKTPDDVQAYRDLRGLAALEKLPDAEPYLIELSELCGQALRRPGLPVAVAQAIYEEHENVLKLLAPVHFESYLLLMEWDREPKVKFYPPRRKRLRPLVDALQDLADRKLHLLCISLPPGVGKALANDTPILTRGGWKQHGDLVVGDEVIGMDGRFKKVIAVHPKCMLDCEVSFTNGERIVCHENHEWLVHDRGRRDPAGRDYIAETKRLEARTLGSGASPGHRGHRYTVQLPHRDPVIGEEKELPLDPYTLGVWLGDGANRNPRICASERDRCVIQRVIRNGHPVRWCTVHASTGVWYYDFDIRPQLRSMGMCHSREERPKHIPEEYLTASLEQRLELLAGLLDTDGTLSNGKKYTFTTSDIELRDSFVDLVSTFGWRTCVNSVHPKRSTSGVVGRREHYRVSFTPDMVVPCEISRKKNHDCPAQRAIGFTSIRRVSPKEGNCITVEGDGMYLAGKHMVPTHNTTLAIFFLTWMAGRNPNEPMLTGSHSNSFVRGVYDECLRLMDPNGEYRFADIFPGAPLVSTNAKDCRIDLDKRQRFETLEFTSIGTGNAGLYRAAQLLYCDDLVSGIEVALSRERLDKLWETYTTDLRQRKIGNHCAELHIATRWSCHDCIGRLEEIYQGDPAARFIAVPALDENDESNFDYDYGVGFSTEFYHQQRDIMDEVSWKALYMNQPIEREGRVYTEDELRRYFGLPSGEPDAIIAACDTKDRGKDYCVMPVAYVYGQDYYIDEVICDNGLPDVVDARLIECLVRDRVGSARFESNSAGGRIAQKVQEGVKARGGITHITTKFNTANKETRIIVASAWVKEHCLFRDASVYKPGSEYGLFMRMLCSYSLAGKNAHDDVPDAVAQLAEYAQSLSGMQVEVFKRPW